MYVRRLLLLTLSLPLHFYCVTSGENNVNLINAPFRAAFVDNHNGDAATINETYNAGMKRIKHPGTSNCRGVRAIIYATSENPEPPKTKFNGKETRVLAADCLRMPRGADFDKALTEGKFGECGFLQTIYDTIVALKQSLDTFDLVCIAPCRPNSLAPTVFALMCSDSCDIRLLVHRSRMSCTTGRCGS